MFWWPNTNTNIIRFPKNDRIRIRILFGFPKMTEYEYEYYSAFQKWPNTNIIRLSKNDQIRILFSFPKKFIIWSLKRTVGKRKTNATIASMQCIKQETWGRRWKMHGGEKLNQCNRCDYVYSDPSTLRKPLKRYSGEKSNKCNQCAFVSSLAGDLKRHLKTHSG